MSIFKNILGNFMPHFERREATANLASNGAELVLDVNGDNSAVFILDASATAFVGTYVIQGSFDGINYDNLMSYPFSSNTGLQPAQPLNTEALVSAARRILCASVGGLRKIRVRCTAYTSGILSVVINTDDCDSIHPYVRDQKAATLMVTGTAAASLGLTLTLPAATGLRHYIDRISIIRSMTQAQTASATPTVITSVNIPGNPAWTFGTDAAATGVDKEVIQEFGGAGLAATAVGTATQIIAPVLNFAIWRINVAYRLGL
ncbi:MAG: hypothetical protein K2P84_00010 [Undibacterium sp.]|nr:hypothetical protein [Undibacterium sp.]